MKKQILTCFLIVFTSYSSLAVEVQISVLAPNGEPVEDIVAYIKPSQPIQPTQISKRVEIKQKNKAFTPYITVIQQNQPVDFVNEDDITHHIFSPSRENYFSFQIRSGQTNNTVRFKKTGKISMGCNIHDWMSGYLLVLDTPYFAKTNNLGKAIIQLKELGEANVHIWHPQLASEETKKYRVKITNTKINAVTFQLNKALDDIPLQESGDDFEFLDNY